MLVFKMGSYFSQKYNKRMYFFQALENGVEVSKFESAAKLSDEDFDFFKANATADDFYLG